MPARRSGHARRSMSGQARRSDAPVRPTSPRRPMALIGRRIVRSTGMMVIAGMSADAIDAVYARGERAGIPPDLVRAFVNDLLADEIHAKRVESIANAVTGVTWASTLSIQTIGHGLSVALDKNSKHNQTGGSAAEQQRGRRVAAVRD